MKKLNSVYKFIPKRDANGKWRKLHNEKLRSLYRSLNMARAIKPRRLSTTEHMARMEDGSGASKSLKVNIQEIDL